jgi:hypothetical protein
MRVVKLPLETTLTTGCPDVPQCRVHTEFTKQHEGIKINPLDLISDNGQEIYNFIRHEGIQCVLMAGIALNMCVLGRPFGVKSLVRLGITTRIVSDLVEVFYNPLEPPYITIEQAKWFALGYIEAQWCPITTCQGELLKREEEANAQKQKENNVRIHTNFPGPLVARLKQEHGLEYFVETGTAHGDATELGAIAFDRVWSCDIDPSLIKQAEQRLKDYSNIELSAEASPSFLRRIKRELTRPVLYWLDAHWCGGRVRPPKECPLLEEIEAIGSFSERSVLLIDDINLIEAPPPAPHNPAQWPTMHDLRVALDAWKEVYRFEWYQGTSSRVLVVTLDTTKEQK